MTGTTHKNSRIPFFQLAADAARKATCLKARCGCVIVSTSGVVLSSGYNAPPCEDESQRKCLSVHNTNMKPKSDKTCCIHAEWNAILNALRTSPQEIIGSTLYFMRIDYQGKFTQAGVPYCTVCSRLSLQVGIAMFGLWNDEPEIIPTSNYNISSYAFSEDV